MKGEELAVVRRAVRRVEGRLPETVAMAASGYPTVYDCLVGARDHLDAIPAQGFPTEMQKHVEVAAALLIVAVMRIQETEDA